MRDWAALRAAWRFTATPPAWTETVPLTEACVPWTLLVPEALQVVVATDRSAFEGVGAFAIVTEHCSFATGNSCDEEESAFRQEALAFLALFRALCTVPALPAGRVTVLFDCTAVAAAIARPCSSSLPGLCSKLASLRATLQSRGCPLELVWVPSHDKQVSWCPPVHLCAQSMTPETIGGGRLPGAPGLQLLAMPMHGSLLPFAQPLVRVMSSRLTFTSLVLRARSPLHCRLQCLTMPCAMTLDPESKVNAHGVAVFSLYRTHRCGVLCERPTDGSLPCRFCLAAELRSWNSSVSGPDLCTVLCPGQVPLQL